MNLDKQSVEMPLVAAMLKYKNEDVVKDIILEKSKNYFKQI